MWHMNQSRFVSGHNTFLFLPCSLIHPHLTVICPGPMPQAIVFLRSRQSVMSFTTPLLDLDMDNLPEGLRYHSPFQSQIKDHLWTLYVNLLKLLLPLLFVLITADDDLKRRVPPPFTSVQFYILKLNKTRLFQTII